MECSQCLTHPISRMLDGYLGLDGYLNDALVELLEKVFFSER